VNTLFTPYIYKIKGNDKAIAHVKAKENSYNYKKMKKEDKIDKYYKLEEALGE